MVSGLLPTTNNQKPTTTVKQPETNNHCPCGRRADIAIEADPYPIVSDDAPFGRHLCPDCHAKHKTFKAEQLLEWLDYFKPRLKKFPFEQTPRTAALKERLRK